MGQSSQIILFFHNACSNMYFLYSEQWQFYGSLCFSMLPMQIEDLTRYSEIPFLFNVILFVSKHT
jgi:hypothetical protein